jgi:hypothetical protein
MWYHTFDENVQYLIIQIKIITLLPFFIEMLQYDWLW